jgi:uncharacterized protein (TIGR02246 family)
MSSASRLLARAAALTLLLAPTIAGAQRSRHAARAAADRSTSTGINDAPFRELAARTDDAWNAHDAERFSQRFTSDVDFRLEGYSDMHVIGRDSLRREFAATFARTPADVRHRTTIDRVQLIQPDVSLLDLHVFIERVAADSSRTRLREWAGTVVALRGSTGWSTRALRLRLVSADSSSAMSDARRQIDAANARFVAAFNAGDVATFAKVYATDAAVMPTNSAAIRGRSAIQDYWQGGWGMGIRNVKLTTDELNVTGDMATEVGRYEFDVKPASGAAGADHGKYIVIWKRSPTEGWQWYRDIFNSDVAAGK